jgi:hypothetical protein
VTIAPEKDSTVTFINVFTVTQANQQRLIEDYQSMRQDPGPLPFLQEALTFATFEPGMYETVRTFKPVAKLPESSSP